MPRLGRDEGAQLLERFRRYLRERRLPVTRQRDRIAEVLFAADDHLSVEAIARRLKDRGEHVGLATIYRTLDVLVDSGLVRAHNFGEGFKRYEPMPAQQHHGHLVCVRCGAVSEFQHERLERMLALIADEARFTHQRHRVEIYGTCRACRQRDLGGVPTA